MNSMQKFLLVMFSMFALLVSGCASVQTKNASIDIEILPTAQIRIFNVTVKSTESNVIITGTLHKGSHGRSIIPGHIDITFLSPDNEVLQTVETKYRRSSLNSRDSTFKVEIPLELADGSTIRIQHFRKSIH